ncbi:VOC family protein [Microbacterium sp. NPDC055683]
MGYKVSPYISFLDGAQDALEFYRDVLGGSLSIMRMGDIPNPELVESDKGKVMHGQLDLENGFVIMASDTPTGMPRDEGANVSVTIFGDDAEELRGYFEALSNGGTVVEPFAQAPWGDWFGMLVDPFGVFWMINSSAS